jgi:hypothetical protein
MPLHFKEAAANMLTSSALTPLLRHLSLWSAQRLLKLLRKGGINAVALHYAPVIQSNVLFKYLDGAMDIKPALIGIDCKFESCALHWVTMGSRL